MVSLTFTNALVQSFASKPFIQQALQNVYHPTSVLNFWFGIDTTTEFGNQQLQNGSKECITDMAALWYSGGTDYDTLCQPFMDVIHMAGTKSLPSPADNNISNSNCTIDFMNETAAGNVWYNTVDGNVAQVILIDQLARNVFRGTDNAFKYESISLTIARQLTTQYMIQLIQQQQQQQQQSVSNANANINTANLNQHLANLDLSSEQLQQLPPLPLVDDDDLFEKVMYPTYSTVLATSLMHSEHINDHLLCQALLAQSIFLSTTNEDDTTQNLECQNSNIVVDDTTTTSKDNNKTVLNEWFQYQLVFATDHKNIIDRFGRYPHRNRILNRISTEQELQWLSDLDQLPAWAKSQG